MKFQGEIVLFINSPSELEYSHLLKVAQCSLSFYLPVYIHLYINQLRVDKRIMDTVNMKENPVCCQIDSFSLVFHLMKPTVNP